MGDFKGLYDGKTPGGYFMGRRAGSAEGVLKRREGIEEKARSYWLDYIKTFGHQPKLKEMATALGYECWETAGRYVRKLKKKGSIE